MLFDYNTCTANWVPLTGNCDNHFLIFSSGAGTTLPYRGDILRNSNEVEIHRQKTGHLSFRLREIHTQKITTPHSNQTTELAALAESTKLRVHSTPTGAPHIWLPVTKSRWIQKFAKSSGSFFILCTHSRPENASHTEHNFRWTIKKYPKDSTKLLQLLNYATTHPEAINLYHTRKMNQQMNSNT